MAKPTQEQRKANPNTMREEIAKKNRFRLEELNLMEEMLKDFLTNKKTREKFAGFNFNDEEIFKIPSEMRSISRENAKYLENEGDPRNFNEMSQTEQRFSTVNSLLNESYEKFASKTKNIQVQSERIKLAFAYVVQSMPKLLTDANAPARSVTMELVEQVEITEIQKFPLGKIQEACDKLSRMEEKNQIQIKSKMDKRDSKAAEKMSAKMLQRTERIKKRFKDNYEFLAEVDNELREGEEELKKEQIKEWIEIVIPNKYIDKDVKLEFLKKLTQYVKKELLPEIPNIVNDLAKHFLIESQDLKEFNEALAEAPVSRVVNDKRLLKEIDHELNQLRASPADFTKRATELVSEIVPDERRSPRFKLDLFDKLLSYTTKVENVKLGYDTFFEAGTKLRIVKNRIDLHEGLKAAFDSKMKKFGEEALAQQQGDYSKPFSVAAPATNPAYPDKVYKQLSPTAFEAHTK
jgi:hypothetical protein